MADTSVIFSILAKDQASGVFQKVGGAAKTLMGAFAIGAGIDQLKDAIGAASDLNESVSKSQVVFGSGQGALLKWADTSAQAFGQSKQQAIESAATFGNFFEAMGVGQPKAEQMSTSMVQLAGDLASFNNANPADVLEALRSGLSGQVEPLRKFGVDLSDATLKQEALREGMEIHNGTLTASQKAQVAYSLILAQTKTAQGDFARTSGGLANQQRILSANWDNAKASLGTGLLPVMTKAATILSTWIPKIVEFVQHNKLLVGAVAAVTAGIWLFNIALAAIEANPIGLAIGAIVIGIVLIMTHTKQLKALWDTVWGFFKDVGAWFAGPFAGFFVKVWDTIKNGFKGAINFILGGWNRLHFTLPSIDTHIPGIGKIGGFTIGVPTIPLLDVGGDVLRSGLAVIHAGERVMPAAQVTALPSRGDQRIVLEVRPGGGGQFEQLFATMLARMAATGALKISAKAVV